LGKRLYKNAPHARYTAPACESSGYEVPIIFCTDMVRAARPPGSDDDGLKVSANQQCRTKKAAWELHGQQVFG
jgi:hypothetical protein